MNTSDKIALVVENLTFSYGAKKALNNVSFQIQAGECTLLLGENGAGKSTLFSLITHLYNTHEGHIELCGFDIQKQARQALTKLGVVFQPAYASLKPILQLAFLHLMCAHHFFHWDHQLIQWLHQLGRLDDDRLTEIFLALRKLRGFQDAC